MAAGIIWLNGVVAKWPSAVRIYSGHPIARWVEKVAGKALIRDAQDWKVWQEQNETYTITCCKDGVVRWHWPIVEQDRLTFISVLNLSPLLNDDPIGIVSWHRRLMWQHPKVSTAKLIIKNSMRLQTKALVSFFKSKVEV